VQQNTMLPPLWLSWSPDGKQIAYALRLEGATQGGGRNWIVRSREPEEQHCPPSSTTCVWDEYLG
jgi:hypothetical protein